MTRILFRNAMVWDGSGAPAFPADVLTGGERIRAVARQPGQLEAAGAEIVEANGMTLMPGMIEGHAHISYIDSNVSTELGDLPPEEHTLAAMKNARLLLDRGFTGAYSAASSKLRLDIVIRNAIDAGDIPGPRMRACGPEITVTGGLGDERRAHQFRDSFAIVADGPVDLVCIRRRRAEVGAHAVVVGVGLAPGGRQPP